MGGNFRDLEHWEKFDSGRDLSCFELSLVVLSCLPLFGGTSFDFSTFADFVL
jgi:hypothetical protein